LSKAGHPAQGDSDVLRFRHPMDSQGRWYFLKCS
jgi:hypothetical protein